MHTNIKAFLFCLFIIIGCSQLKAQYSIPWAQEQPSWVFPLWFEDYSGARDTVYIGYRFDPDIFSDSIYGEKSIPIDTSRFNVCLNSCSGFMGMGRKAEIDHNENIWVHVQFLNGQTPVTMTWNPNGFYSDSLPFTDNGNLPRAMGVLFCEDFNPQFNNCSNDVPFLMSDTLPFQSPMILADSFYFDGFSGQPMLSSYNIRVIEWNGIINGIVQTQNERPISIYPNPPQGNRIKNPQFIGSSLEIYVFDFC